jgi:hypothetical protein
MHYYRMFLSIALLAAVSLGFQEIAASQSKTKYSLKSGSLIATTQSMLDKAFEIYGSGDREAFNNYCAENYPDVYITKSSMKVYVVDTDQWKNTVKIRPVGKTQEYWVTYTCIDGFSY